MNIYILCHNIGVNFHPVDKSGLDHFGAWSGPNIGGPAHPTKFRQGEKSVTDVSVMSPDILVIAFHFSSMIVKHTCFPSVRWTRLARAMC